MLHLELLDLTEKSGNKRSKKDSGKREAGWYRRKYSVCVRSRQPMDYSWPWITLFACNSQALCHVIPGYILLLCRVIFWLQMTMNMLDIVNTNHL